MSIEKVFRRKARWVTLISSQEDALREKRDTNNGEIELEHRLHARRVQNAKGAWVDEIRLTTGIIQRGIRGEHLIENESEEVITGDGPIVGVVFKNAAYKIK
jgi:glycerol-3-phosphate dehydrogenase